MNSEKIKAGVSSTDIVALVFVILGGAFAAAGIIMAFNLDFLREHGTGDTELLPVIFGGIGAPFLIAGIILAAVSIRKRRTMRRVVSEGYYVMATVADIRPNFSVQVNGQYPYVIECHYRDSATGELHVFKSRNLFFYPAEFENGQIRVYVDRENMSRYYVDVDSLIPDVQIH
jgi:hypothetical protein